MRRLNPEGRWTRGGVLARTLDPKGGGFGGSHIDWRRKRVPEKTLGPEEGCIVRSYISWGGERNTLIRCVNLSLTYAF